MQVWGAPVAGARKLCGMGGVQRGRDAAAAREEERRCGRLWGLDTRDLGRGRERGPGRDAWGVGAQAGAAAPSGSAQPRSLPPPAARAQGAWGRSEGACAWAGGGGLALQAPLTLRLLVRSVLSLTGVRGCRAGGLLSQPPRDGQKTALASLQILI